MVAVLHRPGGESAGSLLRGQDWHKRLQQIGASSGLGGGQKPHAFFRWRVIWSCSVAWAPLRVLDQGRELQLIRASSSPCYHQEQHTVLGVRESTGAAGLPGLGRGPRISAHAALANQRYMQWPASGVGDGMGNETGIVTNAGGLPEL